ncbi:hypothetical protein AB1K18_19900 [Peribacillus simplex]|uniref:hypothetical protein n=1 Tax=Peribacillus simplex TaxID=1478 RepID=UPI003B8AC8AB
MQKEKRAAWGNTFFHPFIEAKVFITERVKNMVCVKNVNFYAVLLQFLKRIG